MPCHRNIVLVGFMGSGKTSVGKILAKKLNLKFFDTDSIIERATGMKISEIFARFGERRFRDLESELVELLSKKKGAVISTGGGVVVRQRNIENLRKSGVIFWLKASEETIYQRIRGCKDRPLLQVENPVQRIRELLNKRASLYERADYTVETDGFTPEEVADRIIKHYERLKSGENQS